MIEFQQKTDIPLDLIESQAQMFADNLQIAESVIMSFLLYCDCGEALEKIDDKCWRCPICGKVVGE